ncbi:MAG: hypothetical protein EP346_07615 [Bacteroidetes bacterium]|uniref:DUF3291 domain-containing protein n=1 Tax=Phaeocystidibacter marisrubri TaxID=1577780 RepID=A0A6L3ZK36_9FLAO|nr:hypothetical protein [Phaeocystidibacter marisrubri]KAB2817918.1 hypothetical protein F8C82_05805 [Phaeocystidibacter marisrubri]TNE28851.1 MAG: hypothetical protein EP346_07615 [Bacteroidota bacterium]GGH72870.1 hypothetical protein GCM10011318_17300 [Phaeocystidibacter marisrubri]
MIAYISKNEFRNPMLGFKLNQQKAQLLKIAKRTKGFRGLQTKWSVNGVYFMTLWKSEEQLDAFLARTDVKEIFESRIKQIDVHTYRISAINFIPWREVIAMMSRHSNRLSAVN